MVFRTLKNLFKSGGRFPGVSLTLSLLAGALYFRLPDLVPALEYHREALNHGQAWRLITCHCTHFSPMHLFWDVIAFFVLGSLIEHRTRKGLLLTLAISSIGISAVVWTCMPDLAVYRGLSGVDSALFVFIVLALIREKMQNGQRLGLAMTFMLLLAFMGKMIFEFQSGSTIFVTELGSGVVAVPLAHVAGGLAGVISMLLHTFWLGRLHHVELGKGIERYRPLAVFHDDAKDIDACTNVSGQRN